MEKEFALYFVLPSHCQDELSTSTEMQEAFEVNTNIHLSS